MGHVDEIDHVASNQAIQPVAERSSGEQEEGQPRRHGQAPPEAKAQECEASHELRYGQKRRANRRRNPTQKSESRIRVLGVVELQETRGESVRWTVLELRPGHVLGDMVTSHQKEGRREQRRTKPLQPHALSNPRAKASIPKKVPG